MKKFIISAFLTLAATSSFAGEAMVQSNNFEHNGTWPNKLVYNGFGCEGDNISPHLNWEDFKPEGTKSYAVTIHDPDAPTTSGWWHWLVYNIPANITELKEGASKTAENKMPEGAEEAFTDYGSTGFGGACPPKGDEAHHYNVTIYALKTDKLDLDPKTTAGAKLTYMLNVNAIDKVEITGRYGR